MDLLSRNNIKYTSLMVFSTISAIIKILLIAKILGVDEFGIYSMILSIYIFVMFLGNMGLNEGLVKYGSFSKNDGNSEALNKYTSICVYLGGMGIILILIILSPFVYFFDFMSEFESFFLILMFLAFSSYQFNIASTYLRVKHQFISYAKLMFFKNFSTILVALTLIFFYDIDAKSVIIIEALICIFLALIVQNRHLFLNSFLETLSEKERIYKSFQSGFPVMLAIIFRNISLNMDKWIIGLTLGVISVGVYSFSMIVFQMLMILFNYLSTIIGTKWLSEYKRTQSINLLYIELNKVARAILLFSFIPMLLLFFLAPYLVELYFSEYMDSLPLLLLILIGSIAITLSLLIEVLFIATSNEKFIFNISILSFTLSIIFLFIAYVNSLGLIYFAFIFMLTRVIVLIHSVYMLKQIITPKENNI